MADIAIRMGVNAPKEDVDGVLRMQIMKLMNTIYLAKWEGKISLKSGSGSRDRGIFQELFVNVSDW